MSCKTEHPNLNPTLLLRKVGLCMVHKPHGMVGVLSVVPGSLFTLHNRRSSVRGYVEAAIAEYGLPYYATASTYYGVCLPRIRKSKGIVSGRSMRNSETLRICIRLPTEGLRSSKNEV